MAIRRLYIAARVNGGLAMKDPMIAEVRAARQRRADKFDFDVRAIAADARRREVGAGRKLVSFATRPNPCQKAG